MESYGYKNVAVYSNKYLFETKLTASVFSDYPKWIAQHSNKCTYQGSYHMWQYSTQGVIPGISEKVDLNYKIGNWTYADTVRQRNQLWRSQKQQRSRA